jgi:hypothetical protein
MPADHPLAGSPQLRLADLRGQVLVMFHRSMAPGLYDQTLEVCHKHGYRPRRIHHASRIVDGLLVVDSAVSFNVEASALRWPGVVWRPLAHDSWSGGPRWYVVAATWIPGPATRSGSSCTRCGSTTAGNPPRPVPASVSTRRTVSI